MQRKAVSKGGDSYEYKIQLLYQIHDKESSSHQFMAQRACWALQHNPGTGISSVPRREMKPLCREGVPAPKPALVSQLGVTGRHRGQHICPGCAFLPALLHPGEMNRCWVRPGSEGKAGSRGGNLPPTASTF